MTQNIKSSCHGLNDREARLGRHGLLVDGYVASTDTVYQFHGCYWHGHGCSPNSSKTIGERDAAARKKETLEKEASLTHLGYRVVSIWECEWKSTVKGNTMSPIFKNVSLSRSDLSPHMKTFAEDSGFLRRPQRCLIGGMHAQKQLFLTTLLNCYIEHGLVVTHIHQVVQFHPITIFEPFGESVTEARRNGDVDPDLLLLANNAKLVGNSMYGNTINHKTTHRDTKYVADDSKASQIVRSAHFHSLNVVEEELYETTCSKKDIFMSFSASSNFRFVVCFMHSFFRFCYFFSTN